MSQLSVSELQKKREFFKENYGIDIMTKSGRLLLKNELYRRSKKAFINDLVKIEDRDAPGIVVDFKLWEDQEEVLEILEKDGDQATN